jgi:hypothetical protein
MHKPRDVEALLARAQQPSAEALRLHPRSRGKLEVIPKWAIRAFWGRFLKNDGTTSLQR